MLSNIHKMNSRIIHGKYTMIPNTNAVDGWFRSMFSNKWEHDAMVSEHKGEGQQLYISSYKLKTGDCWTLSS